MTAVEQLPDLARDHRDYLWETGWPTHLLYSHQWELAEEFHTSDEPEFVAQCGRQFGKSGWTVWEQATFPMRQPDTIAHYGAPTIKQLKTIVRPHMMRFFADCPKHLMPDIRWHDGEIRYQNGSILYMAGTEAGNAERLRGPRTHQAALDEAGSMMDLRYIVDSIISPMTLTTGGRIIMPSTPPIQPAHDFAQVYCIPNNDRRVVRRTVYDARHVRPEHVARLCRKAGGADSISWRREYLAELVFDTEAAILPEFVRNEHVIVQEHERPKYAKRYVVGDTGFVDLSFWVFGYVDFEKALVVIEDEMVFTATAASDQAKALAKRERELWGNWGYAANDNNAKPYRYADATDLVRIEFPKGEPGYNVAPVDNRDLDATVNALRRATQEHRYRIHPRCKQLIAHAKMGTWNRTRTGFDRIDGMGHFDGIAALTYLVKTASIRSNPFPNAPPEANRENWALPAQRTGSGAPGLARLKRGVNR